MILFGAGKLAKRYINILTGIGVKISFLVDNNQEKWGNSLNGIKIMSPLELNRSSAPIIIANSYRSIITNQLEQMGLYERVTLFIEVICNHFEIRAGLCVDKLNNEAQNKKKRMIVLDNLYGKWGGAESWVHIMGEELKLRKYNVKIIGNDEIERQFDREESVCRFSVKNYDSKELLIQLVEKMYTLLPITLIDISSDYVLWAACILKRYYPCEVKIIAAVLNDNILGHEKQLEYQKYIDSFFCISTKIENTFCGQYRISSKHIFYKVPFADYDEQFQKIYNLESLCPLRIGYACRLCKSQKRADMLPLLISKLEQREVNYQMNIAGDGECQIEIKEYIEKHHLTSKIKMHGFLKKAEMPDYWKQQDVYLNFSEYEGTSLTMLDAMSYGAVPVVTEVSGVNDFIDHKINGLVYPVGDIDGIADGILYLEKNRVLLWEYGNICRQRIHQKCSLKDYIDYIEKVLNIIEGPAVIIDGDCR